MRSHMDIWTLNKHLYLYSLIKEYNRNDGTRNHIGRLCNSCTERRYHTESQMANYCRCHACVLTQQTQQAYTTSDTASASYDSVLFCAICSRVFCSFPLVIATYVIRNHLTDALRDHAPARAIIS